MNETTHVLVVGGMKVMRHKLKRLGVRISWLTDMTRVGNANSDLEDRVLAMPLNDLDMVLSTVKALHEIDPFDHLAAFLDRDQMLASYIAADLGIGYHAPAVVEQFNNKLLMRHRLRVHGLDTTRSAPVTSVEDLLRVGHDFGFPLILKPLDDWGSRNVSRISSPENCETASAKLSGTMLAEEFLSGKELSVGMFSENGHHFPICVTEKFNERVHFVEIGHRLPYVKDTEKIFEFVSQVLTALKLLNGPSHTEVMVKDEKISVIETHARLGGDYIPELINMASGLDLMGLWAQQIIGGNVSSVLVKPPEFPRYAAVWYLTDSRSGTVKQYTGVDEARRVPGIMDVHIEIPEQSSFKGTTDSFSRLASCLSVADTPEETIAAVKSAINLLQCEIS